MLVLNVGGNSKDIPLPKMYDGWIQHLLDIDPKCNPDIVCDAQLLKDQSSLENTYDAVYCSHNLEHYYLHKVKDVLEGFYKVLKPGGTLDINVPHILYVMKAILNVNLDIHDVLYRLPSGDPITAHDIIFGYGKEVVSSGNDFYSHKTAFTPLSLRKVIEDAGFQNILIIDQSYNLNALAQKA